MVKDLKQKNGAPVDCVKFFGDVTFSVIAATAVGEKYVAPNISHLWVELNEASNQYFLLELGARLQLRAARGAAKLKRESASCEGKGAELGGTAPGMLEASSRSCSGPSKKTRHSPQHQSFFRFC